MKIKIRIFLMCLLGTLVGVVFFSYLEVLERQKDAAHWKPQISDSPLGVYSARYTGGSELVTLRIFDVRSRTLLAKRKFEPGISFELEWRGDRVIYQTVDETGYSEGSIALPPTYLDWLAARLL